MCWLDAALHQRLDLLSLLAHNTMLSHVTDKHSLLLPPANAVVTRRQGHQAGSVVCSLKRLRRNG
jgi:hypothetical protein